MILPHERNTIPTLAPRFRFALPLSVRRAGGRRWRAFRFASLPACSRLFSARAAPPPLLPLRLPPAFASLALGRRGRPTARPARSLSGGGAARPLSPRLPPAFASLALGRHGRPTARPPHAPRWCFFRGVGGGSRNENHVGRSPSPKHHNEPPAGHQNDCRKRALKGLKNWGKSFGQPYINIIIVIITLWSSSIELVIIMPFLFSWSEGEVITLIM